MKKIVTLNEDSYYHCGEFISGRYYCGVYGGEQYVSSERQIKVDGVWITWGKGSIKIETVPSPKLKNLEFDGVDPKDYPDFCDAFVTYAEDEFGTPLTEEELEKVDAGDYYDEMYQSLID